MGNFNVVSSREEIRGVKERNLCNQFLAALDLEDVN